jgi:hypothetical protein
LRDVSWELGWTRFFPQSHPMGCRGDLVGRGESGWTRPRCVFRPTTSRGIERRPRVSQGSGWTRFFPEPRPTDCRGDLVGRGGSGWARPRRVFPTTSSRGIERWPLVTGESGWTRFFPNLIPWTVEVTLWVVGDQDGLVRDVSSPQPLLVALRDDPVRHRDRVGLASSPNLVLYCRGDLVGHRGSGWTCQRPVFPQPLTGLRWLHRSRGSGWTCLSPEPRLVGCRGDLVGRGDQD